MKRLVLLFASGSIAISAVAQERVISVGAPKDVPFTAADVIKAKNERLHSDGLAHKTTAASRWYNYGDYFVAHEADLAGTTDFAFPYLWKNNLVMMTYSGTPPVDTNNLVAYGIVTDPAYGTADDGFNNYTYYPGAMKITATDAYTVDSISFSGAYVDNPTRTSVDTFRISFTSGTGAPGSSIFTNANTIGAAGTTLAPYGTTGSILNNQRMLFNPSRLTALAGTGGPTIYTYDVIVNNGATPPSWTADTASNGLYVKVVPCGISVPAGSMIGATVAFISGDAVPAYDTVFKGSPANPPVKYNMFRPTMALRGTAAAPAFPTYLAADRNNGVFVDKLTTNYYVPQWFWSAGTSAASVQYPDIGFRISCTSCGVVNPPTSVSNIAPNVTAYATPNPANGTLDIPFTVATATRVTVTISNIVGQVVASQNMGHVTSGKATFNTSAIPAGVYTYSVIADGQRATGRVVVAH